MRCLKCKDTIREGALLGGDSGTELSITYRESHSENPSDNNFHEKSAHHLLEIKDVPSVAHAEHKSYTLKHRIVTSILTLDRG